ncbi:hypothetical protein TRFO_02850 [Tritrichomonas foetus]|uniref:PAS domain-containing protein n=1 Tax=Tritrichomonas foetus TaxID=1144522 RepID=A0A1J4L0X3_9EUKA|nr:hypothetical protein TRFO_02850 [Tritrichomonas foetus]|eukprot:OHT15525.1 hypothetical protein TRFO_02850 [Tritrichomonas foetus]
MKFSMIIWRPILKKSRYPTSKKMFSHNKGRRNGKAHKRLVPKSIFSIALSTIRDYFSYCQDVVTLPLVFYNIINFYMLSVITIPLILIRSEPVWGEDVTLSNALYFLSFFLRMGSIYTKYSQVIYSSIFNIVLLLILMLPVLIFSPIYKVTGRVPRSFCFITTLSTDFLMHVAFFWTPSQIGTIVGLLIQPAQNQINTTFIILLVILVIFLIIMIIFFDAIVFPQVNFTKGRTLTWVGQTMTLIYLYATLQLLLTRICEIISNGVLQYVLIGIYSIAAFGSIIAASIRVPSVEIKFTSYYLGSATSSIVVLIFIVIKFFKEGIDGPLLFLQFIILSFALILLFTRVFTYQEIKILSSLDSLYHEEVAFDEIYRRPYQFLGSMRIGFKNAHPYVLTFEPFNNALNAWPNSQFIWIQYLRFLSVYFEETSKLLILIEGLKQQKFGGLHVKGFRALLLHTANSRNRHVSSDLKYQFKLLEEQIRTTKNLLVTYWSAIEECSSSSAFDIGKQLNEHIQNIESMFAHLILLYPNNSFICSKFANFLSSVVCDIKQAETWKNRANVLKDHRNFMIDITQQFALNMFPMLPKTLADLQPVIAQPIKDGSMSFDDHLNETSTISSGRNTFGMSDDGGYESSHIRQLGLHAPVPFARNFIILSIAFVVIAFLAGPFTPSFVVFYDTQLLKQYFIGIKTSCYMAEYFEIIPNYLMFEALNIEHVLPSKNEEVDILGVPNETIDLYSVSILDLLHSLDSSNHQFVEFSQKLLSINSKFSLSLHSPTIEFITRSSSSGVPQNSTIKITMREAMPALISNFFSYSTEFYKYQESFFDSDWFIQSIANSHRITPHILDNVLYLCSDVRQRLDELNNKTMIIVLVFAIVSATFWPFGIISVLTFKRQWTSIIKIMNSMPHVAIQRAISHFSNLQNIQQIDQSKKSESKYTSTYIQMVSSRDVKNGLPQGLLLALVTFDIILSICVFIALYFIIKIMSDQLIVIPYRLHLSGNVLVYYYRCSVLILRSLAESQNKPFFYDTRQYITEKLDEAIPLLRSSLNDFFFVEEAGHSAGVLSSTTEIVESLFSSNGNWLNNEILHEKLMNMPNLITLDVIYEIIINLYRKISVNEYSINLNDTEFLLLTHFILDHLYESVFEEIDNSYLKLMNNMISRLLAILFIISAGIFIIGIIVLIVLTVNVVSILKTTRFCLSSLSMVDVRFLTESTNIMQLFSGNFVSSHIGKNSLLPSLIRMQEVIEDCIIVVNEEMCITSFNQAAAQRFHLSSKSINGTHINSAIIFENPDIIETATRLFNDENENEIIDRTFESRVALIDTPFPDFLQTISLNLVNENSKKNQLVVVIAKQDDFELKLHEIESANKKIEELKMSVVPPQLLGKIDSKDTSLMLSIRNGITAYIECMIASDPEQATPLLLNNQLSQVSLVNSNALISVHPSLQHNSMSAFHHQHSQPNFFVNSTQSSQQTSQQGSQLNLLQSSLQSSQQNSQLNFLQNSQSTFLQSQSNVKNKISKFYDIVDYCVLFTNDVCSLRNFGTGACLCFNIIDQNYNMLPVVTQAIEFCKTLIEKCKESEIEIRCSLSYDISATAGMISTKRLSFDYYGSSRKATFKLINYAEPSSIIFDYIMNDFIDPRYNNSLKTTSVPEFNGQTSEYFILQC